MRIEAGDAAKTLGEFILQTGLQVLFDADAVRQHQTQAVSGQMKPADALALMLAGSGLMFERINERTVAVRPTRDHVPRTAEPVRTATTDTN